MQNHIHFIECLSVYEQQKEKFLVNKSNSHLCCFCGRDTEFGLLCKLLKINEYCIHIEHHISVIITINLVIYASLLSLVLFISQILSRKLNNDMFSPVGILMH